MDSILTEEMTIREILDAHPNASGARDTHGGLKRGETLAETCAQRGIDSKALALELNNALQFGGNFQLPQGANYPESPLALLKYIEKKFHEKLKQDLKKILPLWEKAKNESPDTDGNFYEMRELFLEFHRELMLHMDKEERVLFPMINSLYTAKTSGRPPPEFHCGHIGHPISQMEAEHEKGLEILGELKRLSLNYRVLEYNRPSLALLYELLREVDKELREHIELENNYLHPLVLKISDSPVS